MLFLHGPEGLSVLPDAVRRLSGAFSVIAPDIPGYGASDASEDIDDVEDLAYFFLDFLKARNLAGVHVVAHSLGGWIALEMAIRSTQRIASLTLIGPAGLRVIGVPRADIFICPPEELARLLYHGDGWTDFLSTWTAPERVDLFDQNRRISAKYCWQPRLFDPRLERWLHRIDVPAHFVWGEEDRVIPVAHGEALRRLVPGSRLTAVPGCGHMVHAERPAAVADCVAAFIGGLAQ